MAVSHLSRLALTAACSVVIAGCSSSAAQMGDYGNPITGEGLPNPNPTVERNWGTLPDGREWGSTAGVEIDPTDGHIWAYDRCGGSFGAGAGPCETNPVDAIFKFDRHTGEVMAAFGAGLFVTPHGLHVDSAGNVWVADFQGSQTAAKGHQVIKFSPEGEVLLRLGVAGVPGNDSEHFNQPNDVITAPDGSIFVADGHSGQGLTTAREIEEGIAQGLTARVMKFGPDGTFIKEWGKIGFMPGEFRTPHALAFDSQGRLFVADRGNHRIQIFDQEGNYLDSYVMFGRISGLFISEDDELYAIDSESAQFNHPQWMNGVRIGHASRDEVTAFIPPFDAETRPLQGAAGEGVAVDADGNVYAAEGPNSRRFAGGGLTRYVRGGS